MITIQVSDIDESALSDIPLDQPTRIDVSASGLVVPMLIVKRPSADHLVIMNNGAIDQSRAEGRPVFQRSTWWSQIQYHQIFVCDPATVGKNAIPLAWGNISETIWTPPSISQAVLAVSRAMGVEDPTHRLYFGSSAGGFMALALLGEDQGSKAIINNAQFDWTRWMEGAVDQLRAQRFNGLTPDQIRNRYRLTANVLERLADKKADLRCDYHVNTESEFDMVWALPAMNRFIEMNPELSSEIRVFTYSDSSSGHNPLGRAETISALNEGFESLTSPSKDGSAEEAAAHPRLAVGQPKRSIRLKEHTPLSYKVHTPSDLYRETSDSTLGKGPFIARADADGFLRTGNDTAESSPKVIILGGSFIESMFVPENIRFPSILERRLAVAGHPRKILNGGYSGNNTLQIIQSVISKLPSIVDDDTIVLLSIGQSDAEVLLTPGTYWSPKPRIAPIQPPSRWTDRPDSSPEEALRSVTRLLISSAQTLGLNTGVIVSGFRDGDFSFDPVLRHTHRRNRESYKRMVRMRRMIQSVGTEVALEAGLPTFDAHQATNGGAPDLYYDNMHLNERGQEVMAAALEEWLISEFLDSHHSAFTPLNADGL